MTRIVAGTVGGRRLRTPRGDRIRPTSERVREALFSTLESARGPLARSSFLDLFAGSGAVGLEAWSRGAERVVLVEQDRRAAALIRSNIVDLGIDGATVVADRVEHHLAGAVTPGFDVAFLDPPYALPGSAVAGIVDMMVRRGWLAKRAWLAVERSRHDEPLVWPEQVEPVASRRYGDTVLWYGRRSGEGRPR